MRFSPKPGVNPSGRFGGRIEDIVAVTNTGARRSTNTDGHLRIVS
jgi:Xaa-Pro aminopeptidase